LPIFEGGRLRAQLGAANAGYDQAVERYNQTIVGALKDIADQVVRIRSLDTQKKDAARSVAANDRSYQLSREGFRRGLTDYVNVLVAQQQLLRAQETAARIDAERLAAHAQLMAALGGGVETDTDVRGGHPQGGHPSHDESATGAAAPAAASGAKPVAAVARPTQVAAAGASGVPAAR
ncbi:TolC family protein, partial [Burkholderia cepacia]|nr:TolC family protein [Burkholderia cepacia]